MQVPERTCLYCRKKTGKSGLLRLVVREKTLIFDRDRRLSGRGYYLCRVGRCIEGWLLNKRVKKVIRTDVNGLDKLREILITEAAL